MELQDTFHATHSNDAAQAIVSEFDALRLAIVESLKRQGFDFVDKQEKAFVTDDEYVLPEASKDGGPLVVYTNITISEQNWEQGKKLGFSYHGEHGKPLEVPKPIGQAAYPDMDGDKFASDDGHASMRLTVRAVNAENKRLYLQLGISKSNKSGTSVHANFNKCNNDWHGHNSETGGMKDFNVSNPEDLKQVGQAFLESLKKEMKEHMPEFVARARHKIAAKATRPDQGQNP